MKSLFAILKAIWQWICSLFIKDNNLIPAIESYPNSLSTESGTAKRAARQVLLEFKAGVSPEEQGRIIEELGLQPDNSNLKDGKDLNQGGNIIWAKTKGKPYDDATIINIYTNYPQIVQISPLFYLDDINDYESYFSPLSSVLIVQLKKDTSPNQLVPFLLDIEKNYHLQLDKTKSSLLIDRYYFTYDARNYAQTSVFKLAERIRIGYTFIEKIHFEHVPFVDPTQDSNANDSIFNLQWNLPRIHASGTGETGWEIIDQLASDELLSEIIVAVIDKLFDMEHPDINYLKPGYNVHTSLPTADYRGLFTHAHGTNCSGIIAAHRNNTIGISGLAGFPQIYILPVAGQILSNTNVAMAIRYAADNGASVINLSLNSNTYTTTTEVDEAIQYAVLEKNCVICVSAGNNSISKNLIYPAYHPLVIACGSLDTGDQRVSNSCYKSQTYQGSYISPYTKGCLSVVAPGVNIPTTTPLGLGVDRGDYIHAFTGTSAAAPHVSALAAVIFAINPNLNPSCVRDVIEKSSDTLPDYPMMIVPADNYIVEACDLIPVDERWNKSWNEQVGYGRINVYEACSLALLTKN